MKDAIYIIIFLIIIAISLMFIFLNTKSCELNCGNGIPNNDCSDCICNDKWIDDNSGNKCNISVCYSDKINGDNKFCEDLSENDCEKTKDPNYNCISETTNNCQGADICTAKLTSQDECESTVIPDYACIFIEGSCHAPDGINTEQCNNIDDETTCTGKSFKIFPCVTTIENDTMTCNLKDAFKDIDDKCIINSDKTCTADENCQGDLETCCSAFAGACRDKYVSYNCEYNDAKCDSKKNSGQGTTCINVKDLDKCELTPDDNYDENPYCNWVSIVNCKDGDQNSDQACTSITANLPEDCNVKCKLRKQVNN